MSQECVEHLFKAMELAKQMIKLANESQSACDEDCCIVVYDTVRDSAREIERIAKQEFRIVKRVRRDPEEALGESV